MDEEKLYFKLLLVVCSISIGIELCLFIWSYIQILNLKASNIEAIQLAKEGCVAFITLLIGNIITTAVSIFIPKIRVFNLYYKLDGYKYHWIATIFFVLYITVPIASTLSGIVSGYSLIKDAGISLFKMISCLL